MSVDDLKALCRRSDNDVVNAGDVWRLRQALLAAIEAAETVVSYGCSEGVDAAVEGAGQRVLDAAVRASEET